MKLPARSPPQRHPAPPRPPLAHCTRIVKMPSHSSRREFPKALAATAAGFVIRAAMGKKLLGPLLALSAVLATSAAGHAASTTIPGQTKGLLQTFRRGPMAGEEEIVFAVRGILGEHWYANFGYTAGNPLDMRYGPPGGRLCRLHLASGKVVTLLDDPAGAVRDPVVDYDGQQILFSYRKGGTTHYHLYEIHADGTGLRQITDGAVDDIEPMYLPDGRIVFVSSRCNAG